MDINDIRLKAELAKAVGGFTPPAGLSGVDAELERIRKSGAFDSVERYAKQLDDLARIASRLDAPLRQFAADQAALKDAQTKSLGALAGSKVLSDAIGQAGSIDQAQKLIGRTYFKPSKMDGFIPTRPFLAGYRPPDYSVPPVPELRDTAGERITDLERRLEKVEAQRAEAAELQTLRAENKRLRQQNRLYKQRLDVPAFKNLGELPRPDVPPDETRFSTD